MSKCEIKEKTEIKEVKQEKRESLRWEKEVTDSLVLPRLAEELAESRMLQSQSFNALGLTYRKEWSQRHQVSSW